MLMIPMFRKLIQPAPLRWLIALGWTLYLLVLLLQPAEAPVIQTGISMQGEPSTGREIGFSTLHVLGFGFTMLVWWWALRAHFRNALIFAAVVVLLLGISSELLQTFSVGRGVQLIDMIANTIGVALMAYLIQRFTRENGSRAAENF